MTGLNIQEEDSEDLNFLRATEKIHVTEHMMKKLHISFKDCKQYEGN